MILANKFVTGLTASVLSASVLFLGNSFAADKKDLRTLVEYCFEKGERFGFGCSFVKEEQKRDVLKKIYFTFLSSLNRISVSEELWRRNPLNSEFPLDKISKKDWERYKDEPKIVLDQIFMDDVNLDGIPDTFVAVKQYRAGGTLLHYQDVKTTLDDGGKQRKYDGIIKDLVDLVDFKKSI